MSSHLDGFLSLTSGKKPKPMSFWRYVSSYPAWQPPAKAPDRSHMPLYARDAPTYTPEEAKAVLPVLLATLVTGVSPAAGAALGLRDVYRGSKRMGETGGAEGKLQAAGGALNAILGAPALAARAGQAGRGLRAMGREGHAILPGGGFKAYHGSPHDFDQFDLAKAGTGEGAQAFGHGVYLAESPGVAAEFRYATPHKGTGRFYEVAVKADPEHFLDWDKPLSQQSPKVQEVFRQMSPGKDITKLSRAELERVLQYNDPNGDWLDSGLSLDDLQGALEEMGLREYLSHPIGGAETGMSAYKQLAMQHGGWAPENAPAPFGGQKAASEQLRKAGIPGIKYLEKHGNLEGEGAGTSNYVAFDPALLSILRKYGLAAPLGTGAAATQSKTRKRGMF